jgi:hypothetical protein
MKSEAALPGSKGLHLMKWARMRKITSKNFMSRLETQSMGIEPQITLIKILAMWSQQGEQERYHFIKINRGLFQEGWSNHNRLSIMEHLWTQQTT